MRQKCAATQRVFSLRPLPNAARAWALHTGTRIAPPPGMSQTATVSSEPTGTERRSLTFVEGLLGFEQYRQYQVLSRPEEAPFLWLVAQAGPPHIDPPAFVVLPAEHLPSSYEPNFSTADVAALELNAPADARVLLIVTLHDSGRATVNLKGPIVWNIHTGRAKQMVPVNAAQFSTQHPLFPMS